MANRRPGINFKTVGKITVALADNSGLSATDVTHTVHYTFVASWIGRVPTTTGAGFEVLIPKVDGQTITFTLQRMVSRLSVLSAGTCTFRTETSPGGGAFTASTAATTTHTTSDYEKTSTSFTDTSVQSGDILRLNVIAIAGNGGTFCVELEGST